ncbi:hypothetical protein CONPUDRAFT_168909 [Coniophora puteana RWD-64-598 SS2]|uniref:Uncharacterized protein n=1 Tax=Coniophora puteana (strain RWD-64-598) TaxID=741705 RepID=A0A5M3MCI2_CONPW|nr:uncharacterized protein CONPUDRAFT_168909 [Coniophora puteana RWD-64-598 SS2]EIW76351.1 hypothetical protein CONPUDRAFT_168909 [Coniophora puteana RWD-64-598 SS2]
MPPILSPPLSQSGFKLDTAGVSGFFGGEEFISAMSTVHLEKERRWLGWYNCPGSYNIGKCYGQLADSAIWRSLFPGPRDSAEMVFKLDGTAGPRYVGALSGTRMATGHLAYLLMERCKGEEERDVPGRRGTETVLNMVSLDKVNHGVVTPRTPFHVMLLALVPIAVSVGTCIMCVVWGDWYCFSMIALGMIAHGFAYLVVGSGRVDIKYNQTPPKGAPAADGLLVGSETTIILGPEEAANIVTKGRFVIAEKNDFHRRMTGFCALLLLLQFLLQLLLIPQGTLIGQLLFMGSLAASWVYTTFFPAKEHIDVQKALLWQKLGTPHTHRLRFGSRTAMVVFALMVLRPSDRTMMLDEILPNHSSTPAWRRWKVILERRLRHYPSTLDSVRRQSTEPPLDDIDRELLDNIVSDIDSAFVEYQKLENRNCCISRPSNGRIIRHSNESR